VRMDQRYAGTAWARLATLPLQAGETLQIIVRGSDSDSGARFKSEPSAP
jgi:hypothetical protein